MPCAGNATSSEKLPKCCKLLNHGYTCNFLPVMAMQFQDIIALLSWVKNCMCIMSCPGNATSSEKLPKYCKCLIFWQFICQQILPSLRVAGLQFFCTMATQFSSQNLMPGQKLTPEIPNARARTSVPTYIRDPLSLIYLLFFTNKFLKNTHLELKNSQTGLNSE